MSRFMITEKKHRNDFGLNDHRVYAACSIGLFRLTIC